VALIETRHESAFLVDGDDERGRGSSLKACDERGDLLWRGDVAHRRAGGHVTVEEQYAPERVIPNVGDDGARFFHAQPAEPEEQHLPDLVAQGDVGLGRGAGGCLVGRRRCDPDG